MRGRGPRPTEPPALLPLQGPPGTGKTRTLLGLLHVLVTANRQQLPSSQLRTVRMVRGAAMGPILAAADTNAACDNLVAGLLERGVRVVRLGQPAKVRPELWPASLDARVEATESGKRVGRVGWDGVGVEQAACCRIGSSPQLCAAPAEGVPAEASAPRLQMRALLPWLPVGS